MHSLAESSLLPLNFYLSLSLRSLERSSDRREDEPSDIMYRGHALPPRRSTLSVYTGYADGAWSGPPRQSRRERAPSSSFLLYLLLACCFLASHLVPPHLLLLLLLIIFLLPPIILRLLLLLFSSSASPFSFFAVVAVWLLLSPTLRNRQSALL